MVFSAFQVDENLKESFKRDAVIDGKFHFRKDVLTGGCLCTYRWVFMY